VHGAESGKVPQTKFFRRYTWLHSRTPNLNSLSCLGLLCCSYIHWHFRFDVKILLPTDVSDTRLQVLEFWVIVESG